MEGQETGAVTSSSSCGGANDQVLQKVVHKLKSFIHSGVTPESTTADIDKNESTRIEHLQWNISDVDSLHVFEYRQCLRITEEMSHLLACREHVGLRCDLLVPSDLSPRIAQDVLCMSQNEPCGIRGCGMFINLQDKSTCRELGVIDCDPSTVSIFELYLTVKVDRRPSSIVKSILVSFRGRILRANSYSTKVLHSDYQLTKRRLHRPN